MFVLSRRTTQRKGAGPWCLSYSFLPEHSASPATSQSVTKGAAFSPKCRLIPTRKGSRYRKSCQLKKTKNDVLCKHQFEFYQLKQLLLELQHDAASQTLVSQTFQLQTRSRRSAQEYFSDTPKINHGFRPCFSRRARLSVAYDAPSSLKIDTPSGGRLISIE